MKAEKICSETYASVASFLSVLDAMGKTVSQHIGSEEPSKIMNFVCSAIEQKMNSSSTAPIPPRPLTGRVKMQLKGKLKKMADQTAAKAAKLLYKATQENWQPTLQDMHISLSMNHDRVRAVIENLAHYGIINVERPTRKGETWKFSLTEQASMVPALASDRDEIADFLFPAFKQPFGSKSAVSRLFSRSIPELDEDDPE